MSRKLTIEYAREQFEKDGYTLLSTKYINAHSKLDYICPNGHRHSIRFSDWQHGIRCPYCSGQGKPTIQEVKNSFEKEAYSLLSTKYTNSKTNLKVKCPKGHKFFIRWNDWCNGTRCAVCARNNLSAQQRVDKNIIIKSFEDSGWKLIDFEYSSAHEQFKCICPNGHIQTKTWNKWSRGQRCKVCYDISISGKNCHFWKGGKSFEPYCQEWKDKEYKQDIRDRDNNMCLNPYCDSPNKSDLTIHHIDYNKKNCRPSNLITVCRSCNGKANKNRRWHTAWYQAIIKNRYQREHTNGI
jgi:uncharacterized protein YkuJ